MNISTLTNDRVVVQGDSTLTSPAIAALMTHRAEVTFLNCYGRFQGHLAPAFTKNGQLRLAQTNAHQNPIQQHQFVQAFITGKLHNMRTMLLRANRKRKNETIVAATTAIKQTITDVQNTRPDATMPDPAQPQANSAYDRLQGLEGSGTAHYSDSAPTLATRTAANTENQHWRST